jgi:magnesium chelatase family protein
MAAIGAIPPDALAALPCSANSARRLDRAVAGVLPAAIGANAREEGLICPAACGRKPPGPARYPDHRGEIADPDRQPFQGHAGAVAAAAESARAGATHLDLRDIKGQESAKRALEIAAAGGHHLLMIGSPGAGKSMLAARLPSILPPLSPSELLEVSMIASVAGEIRDGA